METLITQYLNPIEVRRLLAVGPHPCAPLERYCAQRNIVYTHHTLDPGRPISQALTTKRFDLAVAMDLEELEPEAMRALIGTLKNVLSERVWVLTAKQSRWQLLDFIALGFRQDPLPEAFPFSSYSYNLETYNHQRDWNNPRFWANPEQWHKRF